MARGTLLMWPAAVSLSTCSVTRDFLRVLQPNEVPDCFLNTVTGLLHQGLCTSCSSCLEYFHSFVSTQMSSPLTQFPWPPPCNTLSHCSALFLSIALVRGLMAEVDVPWHIQSYRLQLRTTSHISPSFPISTSGSHHLLFGLFIKVLQRNRTNRRYIYIYIYIYIYVCVCVCIYIWRDKLWGIGSCDYGDWKVPGSAICKLETQES